LALLSRDPPDWKKAEKMLLKREMLEKTPVEEGEESDVAENSGKADTRQKVADKHARK